MSAEEQARAMGLDLTGANVPRANYLSAVVAGPFVFVAGHGGSARDGVRVQGRFGENMTTEEGYACARSAGLQILRTLREVLGDQDRLERIVKVLCMVNSTPDFVSAPFVANGCSDLFVELFGEAGRHARSAVGVTSLPGGMAVEIELVAQIRAD